MSSFFPSFYFCQFTLARIMKQDFFVISLSSDITLNNWAMTDQSGRQRPTTTLYVSAVVLQGLTDTKR
jgi:hypothetical protein